MHLHLVHYEIFDVKLLNIYVCAISYLVPFKSYSDFQLNVMVIFTNWFAGWRYVPIELCYTAVWRCRFLNTFWPHYTSSIGIYLQSPTCEWVSEKCNNFWTIQDNFMELHRWTQPIKTRVVGKNEYNGSFSFCVLCPLSKLIIGT